MVEIVHLAKDQEPPAGERRVLIVYDPGFGDGDHVVNDARGMTHRVGPENYQEVLGFLTLNVGVAGMTRLYVQGAPEGG